MSILKLLPQVFKAVYHRKYFPPLTIYCIEKLTLPTAGGSWRSYKTPWHGSHRDTLHFLFQPFREGWGSKDSSHFQKLAVSHLRILCKVLRKVCRSCWRQPFLNRLQAEPAAGKENCQYLSGGKGECMVGNRLSCSIQEDLGCRVFHPGGRGNMRVLRDGPFAGQEEWHLCHLSVLIDSSKF